MLRIPNACEVPFRLYCNELGRNVPNERSTLQPRDGQERVGPFSATQGSRSCRSPICGDNIIAVGAPNGRYLRFCMQS